MKQEMGKEKQQEILWQKQAFVVRCQLFWEVEKMAQEYNLSEIEKLSLTGETWRLIPEINS